MPQIDLDCRESNKELIANLEADTQRLLKELKLPRNFAPPDLPREVLDQLDNFEPKADSLKLKKHLLAIQQQTISVKNTTKAMNKIVELCDSNKPQVAMRACITLLKLAHMDDAPDLYPITPKYIFPHEEEAPKKKKKKPAVSDGVGTTPPATPLKPTLHVENLDIPFFDYHKFHLKNQPQEIENAGGRNSKIENERPHPFHLTTPFITLQALQTLLIFILILILIPNPFRHPASPPPLLTAANGCINVLGNKPTPSMGWGSWTFPPARHPPTFPQNVYAPAANPSEFPPTQSLLKYPIRPLHKPERPRMHAVSNPSSPSNTLSPTDTFPRRHIGPNSADQHAMLQLLGLNSLEELTQQTVPASIRLAKPLNLPPAQSESEALATLRQLALKTK